MGANLSPNVLGGRTTAETMDMLDKGDSQERYEELERKYHEFVKLGYDQDDLLEALKLWAHGNLPSPPPDPAKFPKWFAGYRNAPQATTTRPAVQARTDALLEHGDGFHEGSVACHSDHAVEEGRPKAGWDMQGAFEKEIYANRLRADGNGFQTVREYELGLDPDTMHDKAASDAYKALGNVMVKKKSYFEAEKLYTKAIDLTGGSAVLLANRAHVRLSVPQIEQGGTFSGDENSDGYTLMVRAAENDAATATRIDDGYAKAWFRLGLAKLRLIEVDSTLSPVDVARKLDGATTALMRASKLERKGGGRVTTDTQLRFREAKELLADSREKLIKCTLPAACRGRCPYKLLRGADGLSTKWIDNTIFTTVPIDLSGRGALKEAELPVRIRKEFAKKHGGQLMLSLWVSDHLGADYMNRIIPSLGRGWEDVSDLYNTRFGVLSVPCTDPEALENTSPAHGCEFLFHPRGIMIGDAPTVADRLCDIGIIRDSGRTHTIKQGAKEMTVKVYSIEF